MQHRRLLATTIAGLALAAGSLATTSVASAAPASAAPASAASTTDSPVSVRNAASASPDVIGGEKAPATPWEVQLVFRQGSGTYGCTGEQINASWVLTANHCVDGTSAMNVYHSNDTADLGTPSYADALYSAPEGDIALVHISSPFALSSYPSLDLGYSARNSGTGTVMGYGARANSASADGLYQASVSLTGSSTDAYHGAAQHITGITGASNHGDSGGPLIVGGEVVGVCSTGDEADPGANTNASSNYAILSQSGDWIAQTAGL